MENIEEDLLLQIGVNLDRAFVMKFRDYCQENDFKQRTLIRRLVECWLALDPINQEHIYRGRLDEVFSHLVETPGSSAAREVVARTKARVAKQKQKPNRKSSKSA